jgi:hypothetical protein
MQDQIKLKICKDFGLKVFQSAGTAILMVLFTVPVIRRFAPVGALLVLGAVSLPAANAQTASGYASKWGQSCKMRVVQQFDVPMSDALVNLGATEQQSLDQGNTSLSDIKKYGLSFNWEIRGKQISGYCNVNGKGKITEFKQGV